MSIPTLQSRHCFGYRVFPSRCQDTALVTESIPALQSRHCFGYREYFMPKPELVSSRKIGPAEFYSEFLSRIQIYTPTPHSPTKIMSFPKTIYVRLCLSVITRLKRSNPQRPMRASATIRTIYVWVVGTSPVQSNLCTPQLPLSTAVGNKVTRTESREATVETTQQQRQSLQL